MTDLSHLSVEHPIDLEELRQRLVRMSDTELLKFGDASKFMCSAGANLGKPPGEVFVVQLRTRPRVNFFMNKFRKLGFIKYNGGLHVNSSLLSVVLHE
jgi:hypothetical protein